MRRVAALVAAGALFVVAACAQPSSPPSSPGIPRPPIHYAGRPIIPTISIVEVCTDRINGVPTVGHWRAVANYAGIYRIIDENPAKSTENLVFYDNEPLIIRGHPPVWYFIWSNSTTGTWWLASVRVTRYPPAACGTKVL